LASLLGSCTKRSDADTYVALVLAVGIHDPGYVDAYYGPPEHKKKAESDRLTLPNIHLQAQAFLDQIQTTDALRRNFLTVQTRSLIRRTEMLEGKRFTFDEESKHLYDAIAPTIAESKFEEVLAKLEPLLPGPDPVSTRYAAWQKHFVVPPARVDSIFRAAVDEARSITKRHINLPMHESFRIEYVRGKVWSAYNWYQGNAQSLIQVNLDLPISAGSIVPLAAHEGYPGHHVYNTLLEDRLVKIKGWREYTIYPLFSPQSTIAEGTAEYGIELTFPERESIAFHEQVIFTKSGLDPKRTREYLTVQSLVKDLSHAHNQAARLFLDGKITKDACLQYLERYALLTPAKAEQRVRFIQANRAYVITYNHGQDLIRSFINSQADRWKEFEDLLCSPRLPSTLTR